jgi:sterol desaturase/sphingolipid hydroxylase (fatty acid hydroxylase superfamily)
MMDPFSTAAGWLHENLLLPLLYRADMMEWDDIAYGWVLFALYGVAQVALMLAICWPMERFRRLETWPNRGAVSVDIFYTLLNRIGVMPLVTFVLFYQLQVWMSGWLTAHAGGIFPVADGPANADIPDLCADPGLRRLLAPPAQP